MSDPNPYPLELRESNRSLFQIRAIGACARGDWQAERDALDALHLLDRALAKTPAPLLTESAGHVRCRDCPTEITPGDPCVDMRDGTGDMLCQTDADERGLL